MIIKPKINNLLSNYNTDFDRHESLFISFIHICRTFYKKGTIKGNIKEDEIKTNYMSSKNLLIYVVSLICDARNPSIIKMVLEVEFYKYLHGSETDIEIEELTLTKNLIIYLLDQKYDVIYETITFLCSDSIYIKLLPSVNWLSM